MRTARAITHMILGQTHLLYSFHQPISMRLRQLVDISLHHLFLIFLRIVIERADVRNLILEIKTRRMPADIFQRVVKPNGIEERLRRRRLDKMIRRKVLSNEKRIDAVEIGADQLIAELTSEQFERLERRPLPIGTVPMMLRVICLLPSVIGREFCIVLDDNRARLDDVNRLPNVIIVAVDVDAQQINLADHAALGDQLVDVVLGDERVQAFELIVSDRGIKPRVDLGDRLLIALEPQPAPTFVQQIMRIALESVLDAELDERLIGRADSIENLLDDAVLVVLRINLETVALEAFLVLNPFRRQNVIG